MGKVIFLDIDGTVCNYEGVPPPPAPSTRLESNSGLCASPDFETAADTGIRTLNNTQPVRIEDTQDAVHPPAHRRPQHHLHQPAPGIRRAYRPPGTGGGVYRPHRHHGNRIAGRNLHPPLIRRGAQRGACKEFLTPG